ncbi:MAG: pentapeptide repeat-containing protein [Alphaproteobacteria bacterium PRO2]|nr:pentapeptide repeat-containing protein [Alphaproteobacteria bacterium PRO2]
MGGRKKNPDLKIDMTEPVALTAFNQHSAALRERLENHRIWIESNGLAGRNFNGTDDRVIASLDLNGVDLRRMRLAGMVFEKCDFRKIRLDDGNIDDAVFRHCTFRDFDESQKNAKIVSINRVRAKRAQFFGCDLRGIKFNDCDLEAARITDCQYNKEQFKFSYIVGMRADGVTLKEAAPDNLMLGYSAKPEYPSLTPDKKLVTLDYKGRGNCGSVSAGPDHEQLCDISAEKAAPEKKTRKSRTPRAADPLAMPEEGRRATLELADWEDEQDVSEIVSRGPRREEEFGDQGISLTLE